VFLCGVQAVTSSPAENLHTSQGLNTNALKTTLPQKLNVWNLASWSVRTLLNVDGPIETAICYDDLTVMDEMKIDQIINELHVGLM